ncbi:MAG: vanadium-dependent haloperoxidase [Cyclobacteriaceae bacterium]|nr:vanadium-dependent haloperoxidase [Cyclobacteriaceae bacterium SS2]
MNRGVILFFAFATVLFFSCEEDKRYKGILANPESYNGAVKQLTDVIVYDIFSPPVASRVYVYPNIAAFEVLAALNPDTLQSLAGQVTDLSPVPAPPAEQHIDPNLASIHAFLTVGKTLIFSENKIDEYRENFYARLEETGLPSGIKKNSLAYGEVVAKHILQWADGDMYKQTRTFPKYTVQDETFKWKPTPPDYMEGIEPHWNKIRPMILDSARQFSPKPPLEMTMEENSGFYKELKEVYDVGVNLDEESTNIAKFWDCNPYVSHHRGHAMFATKKITPGGHWIGIVAVATRTAGSDFDETVEAYVRTSISLFDGFISCWDEKWRSIVVRPETLIHQYLDEKWVPLLQTPPFPEYTSGHSVISRAAAITLTDYFGDHFFFTDTTENEYGLPTREFDSFLQASEEAAISRLYGGIHYRMAIEQGVSQGEDVGDYVVSNLKTRKVSGIAAN